MTRVQLISGVLMWVVAGSFGSAAIVAYRLRFHVDLEKLKDPEEAHRFINRISLPPWDLLTEKGQRLRKWFYVLLAASGIAMFILVCFGYTYR
jgi:hypothetical protein